MKQTVHISDEGLKILVSIWDLVMKITDLKWGWEQIYMDEARDKATSRKITKLKFPCEIKPNERALERISEIEHVDIVEYRDKPKTGKSWSKVSSGIELFLDCRIHD